MGSDSKGTTTKGTKAWRWFSLGSAVIGASLAQRALDTGWRKATGKKPPTNPADPTVSAREAMTWAVVSSSIVTGARVLATRRAANYYLKSTGTNPPAPKLPRSARKKK